MNRLIILGVLIIVEFVWVGRTFGATGACSVSTSPSYVLPSTDAVLTFSITNSGPQTADWIRISWSTDYYTVGGFDSGGWSVSGSPDAGELFFSGSLGSGAVFSNQFEVTSRSTAVSNTNWSVQMSDDGGLTTANCSGNLDIPIGIPVPAPSSIPAPAPTTTSTSNSTTTTTTTVKATPTPTPKPTDKTVPTISIDFYFSKPFREAPKITGIATDTGVVNPGVAKVEYSTDDGKNWISVDKIESRIKNNELSKTFEFTPQVFEDGDYKIKARATDLTGNRGVTKSYTLVIDRLPPQVGGTFISFGPQGLLPGANGITYLLKGLDQKITLSAVGGPISIDLLSGLNKFTLTKNTDNGLWSGTLNFSETGIYPLTANSLDGAGNITERTINTVEVLDTGRVIFDNKGVRNAQVSVYYLEPSEKQFVLWDAESYGQKNPQKTAGDGSYALFLPGGSYYIEVLAPGFRTFKSDIFTIDKSFPINSDIVLEKEKPFKILFFTIPIPDFTLTHGKVSLKNLEATPDKTNKDALIGKEIPEAELQEDGKKVKTSDFRGKPFVLTFVNIWLPQASEQIKILENISDQDKFKVVTIMPQETASKVGIYKKRGGYALPIYADSDGVLVIPLNLQSLPTHVFLDRTGKIIGIKTGILSEEEINNNFQ